MTIESEVRKASEAFYAALNRMGNGVKGAMTKTWSHGTEVTAMHPIGGRTTRHGVPPLDLISFWPTVVTPRRAGY